ncbi:hypothetical protein PAXRUDRAFT_15892 [Paxillus rubicundulus Ve08.2h10]|uniref:Uncharacterized protein n=1 Tax=Paxillus rubicundulus Ve08.2h10 TaxID=930991 RepID=A0A0D0CXE8_9AGAM|nr:hypothetical protein PAXRUDRAFT_15892 [Paxillus rubicundulus Ve08.2h10]
MKMVYSLTLNDSTKIQVPNILVDGPYWLNYREAFAANKPGSEVFLAVLRAAHMSKESSVKLSITRWRLEEARRIQREAAYSLGMRNDIRDMSRCDDNISNRSAKDVPKGTRVEERCDTKHCEQHCTAKSARGEELRSRGDKAEARRTGESTVTATGPGEGTADQNVCSVSLAATPSSLGDDGRDPSVHCACTIPQTLNTPHETVSGTATDTANPNVKSARPTKPGTGGKGERDERASGSVTPSSDNNCGDEVRHTYAVPDSTPPPPNPDKHPPPPSMPLEGENRGEQLSGHVHEMGMHLERPQAKLTTTPPIRMPCDKESSRED